MNRLFLAFDGDNAGQHVGTAVLMDDAQKLHEISNRIDAGGRAVKAWVMSKGGQMVSLGGDEGVAIIDPRFEPELEDLRAKYQQAAGFSATMGIGFSLSQAGKALLAGKLQGKDQLVKYDSSIENILEQAHEHPEDEEAEKINEHYLDHVMGGQDDDIHGDEHEGEMDMEDGSMDQDGQMEPMDEEFHYHEDRGDDEDLIQRPEEGFDSADRGLALSDQLPEDESQMEDPDAIDDPDSFENESMIELPMSEDAEEQLGEDSEDKDPEKAIEAAAEEGEDAQEPAASQDQGDISDLESMLSDNGSSDEVRNKIAQNLEQFKQNKELLEQIKDQNPELYATILGLFQNLIELARASSDAPQQAGEMEDPSLPKQSG